VPPPLPIPALSEKARALFPNACIDSLGNIDLLNLHKTALFCSSGCPGSAILGIYDQAAQWRDEGRCIISGFHSPVEKECLKILLRGSQPIIICPARTLHGYRIPKALKRELEKQRLLLISPFPPTATRISRSLADKRNEFILALADEVHIAHAAPGSKLHELANRLL
jgi:predicted Rossmann fold nucleotide-binding protein DprA/Smf involved in DNA uptake